MGEVGGKERNGDTGLQADRNEEIHFNMGKKKGEMWENWSWA